MTDTETSLRNHLVRLLDWEDAHVNFDRATAGIPPEMRSVAPEGIEHSAWQLLEHQRLAQFDILDFCINPDYVEPASMDEYWPASAAPPSESAWDESIASFRRDLEAVKRLALDPNVDLFATIPHGAGQTYLREIILVADHNAYHVGQMVLLRRSLGLWPPS